jgi:hypothetical protein
MSKKAAKKGTKKKAVKKSMKTAPRSASRMGLLAADVPANRTSTATIFVYDTGAGKKVRTSPQLLTCPPGYIEWTVVNLTSGPMPDVDITWPAGGPWGGGAIPIRNGNARKSFADAKAGRYKYNVTCEASPRTRKSSTRKTDRGGRLTVGEEPTARTIGTDWHSVVP